MNVYKQNGETLVTLCGEGKATTRYNHEILEDVLQLLKSGANPNYFYPDDVGDSGTTPLSSAMYGCLVEVMILLKHYGAEFGETEYEVLESLGSQSSYLYKAFPELVQHRPAGRLFEEYATNPDANMHQKWEKTVKNILAQPYSSEIKKILKTALK